MSQESPENQSKSAQHTNKELYGQFRPECAYCNNDRPKVLYRKTFLAIVSVIVISLAFYYIFNNYIYTSSSRSIITLHESYINDLENGWQTPLDSINIDSISAKDSKVFLQSLKTQQGNIMLAYKEEAYAIKSMLQMHLTQIEDNFNSLTLWSSVLMIIFLVFSLYAMYKMDEMQHRGSESLDGIYKAHADVLSDIKDFNKTYAENISKLESAYNTKIKEINESALLQLQNLNEKILDSSKLIDSQQTEFKKLEKKLLEKSLEIAKKCKDSLEDEVKIKLKESTATLKELFEVEKKELYRIVSALNLSAQLNKVSTPSKTNTEKPDKSEESANANASSTNVADNSKGSDQAEGGDTKNENNSVDN